MKWRKLKFTMLFCFFAQKTVLKLHAKIMKVNKAILKLCYLLKLFAFFKRVQLFAQESVLNLNYGDKQKDCEARSIVEDCWLPKRKQNAFKSDQK